jgi:hypothetical protein
LDNSFIPSSKRVDVVHNRDLSQDHLADDVARLDVRGVDRRVAGGAGGQFGRELGIVELEADNEWRRCDLPWRNGQAKTSIINAVPPC